MFVVGAILFVLGLNEEALANARKSVTGYDLDRFEQFRRKYDPAYASKVSGVQQFRVNWPDDNSSQF